MINVLRFSYILTDINYLYINMITDATAHGSSSERDKWILNFLFLNIFFRFFKEMPFLIPVPNALLKASLAANLFA